MASGKPVYYWDTSIWIVYFNEGKQHPDVFDRLEEIVDMLKKRQATLLTSVLTRIELLQLHHGPEKLREYDAQLNRRNVHDVSITRSIATLASDYRNHFPTLRKGRKLSDAIHLATAVDAVVDEMHTTDADDLLPCNGDAILRGTQVIRPVSASPKLFTGVPPIAPQPPKK